MAQGARGFIETTIELSDEEQETVTTRAQAVGMAPEFYLKMMAIAGDRLPEPSAFFPLLRRLAAFGEEYQACMRAFGELSPTAMPQSEKLGETFAQLLQDWDALYGPR